MVKSVAAIRNFDSRFSIKQRVLLSPEQFQSVIFPALVNEVVRFVNTYYPAMIIKNDNYLQVKFLVR